MTDARRQETAKLIFTIGANLAIIVFTVYSVLGFFVAGGDGNMKVVGVTAFRYFTVDSNILAAVSSLVVIICAVREYRGLKTPGWVRIFNLAATVSVMLTLLTVVCFLGPFVYGYPLMFEGTSLYMHLVTPLIKLASFVWLESINAPRMKRRYMIFGIAPMLAYGAVYCGMVVLARQWEDFYSFNQNGLFPLSVVIMVTATAAISYAVGLWANFSAKWLKI